MIKKLQERAYFKFIVLAVVFLIPVIYSFFYLKSYWDPYGHLDDITVGILNLDKGVESENRGDEFAKELKDSGTLNFVDIADKSEAEDGLGNDKYYAVITIPENFTENLNSASTADKKVAKIIYTPNKRKNYLASQILNSALKTVEINLQAKVSKEVTRTLSESLEDVPSNLQKISDGALKISDGAASLNEGLGTLSSGLRTLNSKYVDFNNGVNSAYVGSKDLSSGINQVSSGVEELLNGTNTLGSALTEVNSGISSLEEKGVNGINEITSAIDSIDSGANTLSSSVAAYVDGTETLALGTSKYVDGATLLANGVIDYTDGVSSLANGVIGYTDGVNSLASGITAYVDGAEAALNGASSYIDGINQINNSKTQVLNALIAAADDNPELASLAASASQIIETENQLALTQKSSAVKSGILALTSVDTTNLTKGGKLKLGASSLIVKDETGYSATEKLNLGAKKLVVKDSSGASVTEKLSIGAARLITKDETGASAGEKLSAGAEKLIAKDENGLTYGKKISKGMSDLHAGTSKLKEGSANLYTITSGVTKLKNALSQIKGGSNNLSDGLSKLKSGNLQVYNGANTLVSGLNTLNSGSESIKDALSQLSAGSNSALSGSETLKEGVEEFKNEIDSGIVTANNEISKLNGLDEYVEDPVVIEEQSYGEVNSYGIAFAPLFISIGLWVGALMCYVVLYYDQRHRFGILDHDTTKSHVLQNIIYLIVGALEGIITGILLKVGLGFEVQSMAAYIGECILTGVVFMAVIQFLIKHFGDIGKFLALIILVLQLAASGGTFPVETIDSSFKAFTSILPMTYSIRAFKDVLIPTSHSLIASSTWVLIILFIVLNVINIVIDIIKSKVIKDYKA